MRSETGELWGESEMTTRGRIEMRETGELG